MYKIFISISGKGRYFKTLSENKAINIFEGFKECAKLILNHDIDIILYHLIDNKNQFEIIDEFRYRIKI